MQKDKNVTIVKGKKDRMIIDKQNRELRISADVTKNAAMPAVVDWGRRFQAWFGSYGGKMVDYFVFTTDVSRTDIDKAIQGLGIKSRRQIPMDKVKDHTGLKATTQPADYLDGDPMIVTVRFIKGKDVVEAAIEDFIQEKITVDGAEVIKPYTPHWVYHGTGEAINFPSGCMVTESTYLKKVDEADSLEKSLAACEQKGSEQAARAAADARIRLDRCARRAGACLSLCAVSPCHRPRSEPNARPNCRTFRARPTGSART